MGQIEAKVASSPPTEITPHHEAEHPDRINVEQAIRRWLDGQDDSRLPSFEDLQIDIETLKLRPEEKKLVRAVEAMRKLTENSG